MIKQISDLTPADFYPMHFANELYCSRIENGMEPFVYQTNLTIKFTHSGIDYYKIDNKERKLKSNQFLIINSGTEVSAYTNKPSEGMSVFMNPELLAEVVSVIENPESCFDPDGSKNINFFEYPHYCDTVLGLYLRRLFQKVAVTKLEEFNPDLGFYYSLAELMIQSQIEIEGRVKGVNGTRRSVKEEIYRRIMAGKEFIDSNIFNKIHLDQISKMAGLSKYYFVRCFKNIYGLTPHQYILMKRIEKAKAKLINREASISSISNDVGFSDIHSFSKAFKKMVGIPPSAFPEYSKN